MQRRRKTGSPGLSVSAGRRSLRADRHATTALEFAILGASFILLVLGAFEVGYDFFVASALDYAVHVAARSVQVGTATGSAKGSNAAAWVTSQVCPALGKLLSCNGLYVSIAAVPSGMNYYAYLSVNPPTLAATTSSSNSVCTGGAGQMMLLSAYYLGPSFLGGLVPGWSQPSPLNPAIYVHVSYASAGFVNEYFTGGETGC
jgi:Flp pilus assembly protein TadG